MLWKLYPLFVTITLVSVIAVAWYATSALRDFHLDRVAEDLESRAHLVSSQLAGFTDTTDIAYVDNLCNSLGRCSSTRITVIHPTGIVLGDSEEDPLVMENHRMRSEIRQAFQGKTGRSIRYSSTMQAELMYVAIPVIRNESVVAVVRTSIPVSSIDEALHELGNRIALACIVIALVLAFVSWIVSRSISRPLEELKDGVMRYAGGQLNRKIRASGSEEIDSLTTAVNEMAGHLYDRIRTVTRQRNEREAILASMAEGVIAFDVEEKLIEINQTAAGMLNLDANSVQGRSFHEVIRNAELQQMVESALSGKAVEGDVVIRNGVEKVAQVHGTVLRNIEGNAIGALLVLNDVTRVRQLERIRQDFVANVSHELKTPITSIKGFVETLLDSFPENRAEAQRFLGIIGKHADRLDAIIEDLLSLSRLEQERAGKEIRLDSVGIVDVLSSAAAACDRQASEKKITIDIVCDDSITAMVNPLLLEQVIVNILDNAIKYSGPEDTVNLRADYDGEYVEIRITDNGIGIERKHLPRIFERFYRVDKARSRDQGGTGLGLAIVKHIVLAHGGNVLVESTPGRGSTFIVKLPRGQGNTDSEKLNID